MFYKYLAIAALVAAIILAGVAAWGFSSQSSDDSPANIARPEAKATLAALQQKIERMITSAEADLAESERELATMEAKSTSCRQARRDLLDDLVAMANAKGTVPSSVILSDAVLFDGTRLISIDTGELDGEVWLDRAATGTWKVATQTLGCR